MQRLLASISTPTLSVICPFGLLLWLYTASITRLWLAAVPGDETIFRHNSPLCGPRTYCVFLDDQYGMGAIYRDPQLGERVQDQDLRGQAPRLAHWSHLTHGLFETCVTSPACRTTAPHPYRVTVMGWGDGCPQPSHLQLHFLEGYPVCPKPNGKI